MFELRDQRVELLHHRLHRLGLAKVDAGALEQRHRMVAAARFQQCEIALDRVVPLGSEPLVSCFISCALDAKQVAYW